MKLALRDVTNGVMGVRKAALEYNVPRSTLSDRVTGRVQHGAHSGAPHYLKGGGGGRNCPVDLWLCRNRMCEKHL